MPWLQCLCAPDDAARLRTASVSAPLHLLIKGEGVAASRHSFRTKQLKKPRPCHRCHQLVYSHASSCRLCKYLCHKGCEEREGGGRPIDVSRREEMAEDGESLVEERPAAHPPPSSPPALPALSTSAHHEEQWWGWEGHSRRKGSAVSGGAGSMDVSYVTERLLLVSLPGQLSLHQVHRSHVHLTNMLNTKHPNNYLVVNLTGGESWLGGEEGRWLDVGWGAGLAPPLDKLCQVCKQLDSWLSDQPSRVALLYARGSRERLAVVVAAYMHYSSICGSPEQALDRYAMKSFLDHNISPDISLPSNKRYVEYFGGLLSGSIRVNSASLCLTHVTVVGAPSFTECVSSGAPSCRAFLKVYQGLNHVFTSGVHTVGPDTRQFTVSLVTGGRRPGLHLRGDIIIKCYHRHYWVKEEGRSQSGSPDRANPCAPPSRQVIFACQFHTCAVSDNTLTFTKNQLDFACTDERFPSDGAVELHFGARGERTLPAPTPAVPVDLTPDPVTAWDSLQQLPSTSPPSSPPTSDHSDTDHLSVVGTAVGGQQCEAGPGSLYASVVTKESVSMDSGISSAGVRCAPPPPENRTERELDRLLDEMLTTVRDLPEWGRNTVPYHARHDSRPFTYGNPLHSPGLVRRASLPRTRTTPPLTRSPTFHEGQVVSGGVLSDSWLERQQAKLRERRDAGPRYQRAGLLTELTSSSMHHRLIDGYTSDPARLDHDDDDDDDLDDDDDDSDPRHRPSHRDYSRPLHVVTGGRAGSAPVSPLLPHRTSSRPAAHHHSLHHNESVKTGVGGRSGGGRLLSVAPSHQTDSASDAWPSPSTCSQVREESSSGWRSGGESVSEGTSPSSPRPHTPAFPTPSRALQPFDSLPPRSPTMYRREWSSVEGTLSRDHHATVASLRGYDSSDNQYTPKSGMTNGGSGSPSVYYGHSRRSSLHSTGEPPTDVSPAHVKFVRDTSRFWYKPTISREQAISLLREQSAGTFVVRDSNSFPGAFGLAVKVAVPPGGVTSGGGGDPSSELVRHFLIEPTSRGVRLKGCSNEPVFSSLSALVYQHSVTALALPCRLVLPDCDLRPSSEGLSSPQILLSQGAACNVLYLGSEECECLTGPEAVGRAVSQCLPPRHPPAIVHFKVSSQGITLTDSKRQVFFRRHYPTQTVSHCGLDPSSRSYRHAPDTPPLGVFGFVSRRGTENQCHIFSELEPGQPATAIVNFVSKVMMGCHKVNML